MRWEERVDDAALGLIQLCCQWHADTIKPEVVHCQVHLAAHFLISATAVLAAVIQMIARKLNRLAYLEDVFRICSLKHQHWVDLGNSQNKFCVFKVLFCFFVWLADFNRTEAFLNTQQHHTYFIMNIFRIRQNIILLALSKIFL